MNKGKYILEYYTDKKISYYNDIFNILSVEGKRSMICIMIFFSIIDKDPGPIIFLRSLKIVDDLDIKLKHVLVIHELLLYSYKKVKYPLETITDDYHKNTLSRELCEAIEVITYVDNNTDEFDILSNNNKVRFLIDIIDKFKNTRRYEFYLILKYLKKYYDDSKDYMIINLLNKHVNII
ncbi:SWPV1-027 [Shearwaterpox virus]|uniref:SWPV1-027 n=1 Tax=Shearwaterpox virus TaxID=1974596 RepID=A0A1V0S7N7_CNPV|nr:SWPV1-027 [Shearwaterpox virus]